MQSQPDARTGAVDAAEAGVAEAIFEDAEGLGGEVLFLGGEDPDEVAFGLKGVDLGGREEDVFGTGASDDFAGGEFVAGGGDFLQARVPVRIGAGQ